MRAPAFCFVALVMFACGAGVVAAQERGPRLKMGDDPRWAAPAWGDSDWTPVDSEGIPMRTGVLWLRLPVHLSEPQAMPLTSDFVSLGKGPIDSIYLSPAFTFELYWDGRLLDRNGRVGGSASEEQPGVLNRLVRIPPELLGPGEHLIALRISSYHYNFPATHSLFHLTLENYERRLIQEARRPVLPLIGVGGALLVAALCLMFHFLAERRRPFLIGAALGVAMALFYGLISLRWLLNLSYDWHCPRLTTITAIMAVIAVLLPWMLVEQFAVPRKKWLLGFLLPLLVGAWLSSPIYEVKTLWLCRMMLVASLVAVGWATWQRRPGAWFVLLGIIAGLLVVRTSRRAFLDPSFFLVVEMLVLMPLVSFGVQVRAERRRAREAVLVASRLETELLKKNIQPHFLINTLATIMEIIERDPRAAITLIESLAAEFRILARVSGFKLIPLTQELDLCRAHLRIMSLRKDARCTLDTQLVDEAALVPPALFHTLVENGLTHLRPRGGEQRFTLRQTREGERLHYTLTAEGEPARRTPAVSSAEFREGTGIRYIKARLDESFAGGWKLDAAPVAGGWRTSIQIGPSAPPAGECCDGRATLPPREQPA